MHKGEQLSQPPDLNTSLLSTITTSTLYLFSIDEKKRFEFKLKKRRRRRRSSLVHQFFEFKGISEVG
ncbi:hypothetical protein NC653_016316 [Populus alba x Populus x berolinensis]|uniref:Uncharacterized protein n=1 Tax=Populus alba x Populus x berolinensis TaxID=444605 RepID=A0AAD6QMG5_9ROSI|nr:hypothetical protein NC653_016316 [Populus alba x Populus x berolinensis]